MDYLSTHLEFDPNLWLEVGSNARLDRNWVYDISNTTFENIQARYSVLIVQNTQSKSTNQSLVIHVIVQEHVQVEMT